MSRKPKPWFDKHNGKWYTTDNGERVKLADGPKNATTEKIAYDEFYKFMSRKTSQQDAVKVEKGTPLSVLRLFDLYLISFESEVAIKTWKERKYYLEEFAFVYGNKLVSDLIPLALDRWMKRKENAERWKSDDSKATVIRNIKAAFNWGVKQWVIDKNPFQHTPVSFRNKRKPVSEEQYQQVLALFDDDPRMQETLQFLFWVGCRPSELRRARWADLDLEAGTLLFGKHKTSKKQKISKPRKLILIEQAIQLLQKIKKRGDHDEFIFVNYQKRPYTPVYIQKKVREMCEAAELPFTLHTYSIRHCFGTSAIKKGVSLKVLAELMGHNSTRTTEGYIHIAGDVTLLREAAEKVRGST